MTERPSTVVETGHIAVIRLFGDRFSFRLHRRGLLISLVLIALILLVAVASLTSGSYQIPVPDALDALLGQGEDMVRIIVVEWRLPRVLLAILLGAALGMSGAIFQSLTRNPLGSPDIIGFAAGSYTGALIVIVLLSGNYYEIAAGALTGGVLTALAVYLLAWRNGMQGFRLIIVGIGISAMLSAFNGWMIKASDLNVAMSAAIWGAGSLNGLGFDQLVPVAIVLLIIMPLTMLLARPMRQLEMGDDAARASGVNANRTRALLMVLGVALTATVTAAAGPIAFIALAAPQIARRITRSAGVALIPSALTGSGLLAAADYAAQHAFETQLPVGIMTVSIGGIYFLWLLVKEGRG
ncbi:iron chelate uptake ABC transporter family permease subunit [Brucella pseudogrignonensis]|uniref:FecCD family ABC transporter permease n=1 Tax=Brucella pseudogrignonensis TaxID=419475 RepID=UPI001EDB309F|nr:iron chelate uptake ABC transporter family permease subunit [Brucella pseudogrignonensis]UKK95387.1 iron chelate uptake ABC transporter family permease subunit [Brucella pseudogrignonensis]